MKTGSQVEEARTFAQSAAVRAREDLLVLRVSGDDAVSWLNGQLTNDVRAIPEGQGVYALAVNVRGKILADAWVLQRRAGLTVLLPRAAAQIVLESFERQIIMEDVELVQPPEASVVSVQGPRAREVAESPALDACACDELGFGGFFVIVETGSPVQVADELRAAAERAGGGAVSEAAFDLARLRVGRPRYGQDFGEQQYPQEAGLTARAVSFQKGCYLGQEVVCTLENRGRINRELLRLQLATREAPAAATEVVDGEGRAIGTLTSAALDPDLGEVLALGYVKRSHMQTGSELRAAGASARVLGPCAAA